MRAIGIASGDGGTDSRFVAGWQAVGSSRYLEEEEEEALLEKVLDGADHPMDPETARSYYSSDHGGKYMGEYLSSVGWAKP